MVQFSSTAKGLASGVRLAQDEILGARCRMMAAYKMGRNFQDMLVHSKLGPVNKRMVRGEQFGVYRITKVIPLNMKNCAQGTPSTSPL